MIDSEELLLVVDENNNPVAPLPRKVVHGNHMWHRTSHIWIFNGNTQVLCQKRSLSKDSSPGMWESYFGGHLGPQDEYLSGALSELNEELEISAKLQDLHQFGVYKSEISHEFQGVFYIVWGGDVASLEFEKEEIDELRWYDLQELESFMSDPKDSSWVFPVYGQQIIHYLKTLG